MNLFEWQFFIQTKPFRLGRGDIILFEMKKPDNVALPGNYFIK